MEMLFKHAPLGKSVLSNLLHNEIIVFWLRIEGPFTDQTKNFWHFHIHSKDFHSSLGCSMNDFICLHNHFQISHGKS